MLEISELRTEEEADDSPSTADWLRTSAGTLGVILLAAGAYGIWRGNGRHDLNA